MKMFMCAVLLVSLLFAQQVTVDLKDLSGDARNAVINSTKKNFSADDIEKYSKIGQAVGEAFKSVCQTLNVEVNAFVKTPVGKIMTVMLVWKIFGEDIKGMVGAALFVLIGYPIYFFLLRHFLLLRIVKLNGKEEIVEYKYDGDAKLAVGAIFVTGAVIWVVAPILMFFN